LLQKRTAKVNTLYFYFLKQEFNEIIAAFQITKSLKIKKASK